MKKISILFAIIIALGMSKVNAQAFDGKGSFMLGPTVGLSWGAAFGVTADYGINDNWSIGGDVMYTSYSETIINTKITNTLIGVLAAASYHFDFLGKEWDPYLKGGLGYMNWSGTGATMSSGIGFALQGGARYYLKDNLALRASLGFPYYIGVGVDFKIK